MRPSRTERSSATAAMPPQDAAWLGMDHASNLMVVTAVLLLDGRPDEQALRSLVQQRIVDRFPSFHRRAARGWRPWPRPVWQDHPGFDVAAHVRTTNLTGPLDVHLDPFIADQMSRPLDLSRPPWLMHLVCDPDGASALVVRVHHCVGDGIALAQVLLSLTDPATPVNGATLREPTGKGENPPAVAVLQASGRVVRALVGVLLMSHEPQTQLRGTLGTRKVLARGPGVDLALVKQQADGATVNDAVLAAVAGGLRRRLVAGGERPTDVRVLMPVDLRSPGAPVPASLGNHFGMAFVRLPVAEPDADQRLAKVRLRSSRAKASAEATATFVALTVLGTLPTVIMALAVRLLGARATAVVTNVAGPRHPVLLAGRLVRQIAFWVPQTGVVGLGISVFSYAGTISVGVAVDARLSSDPSALVCAIEDELGGSRPARLG